MMINKIQAISLKKSKLLRGSFFFLAISLKKFKLEKFELHIFPCPTTVKIMKQKIQ